MIARERCASRHVRCVLELEAAIRDLQRVPQLFGYGRGAGVGRALGVGVLLGVGVGGGLVTAAQYLPPMSKKVDSSHPPQTIISLPVHTAV